MRKIAVAFILLSIVGCDRYKSYAKESIEQDAKQEFSVEKVSVDLYEYSDLREVSESAIPPWEAKAKVYFEKDGEKICKDADATYTAKHGRVVFVNYNDC
jgi:hypothetical protein